MALHCGRDFSPRRRCTPASSNTRLTAWDGRVTANDQPSRSACHLRVHQRRQPRRVHERDLGQVQRHRMPVMAQPVEEVPRALRSSSTMSSSPWTISRRLPRRSATSVTFQLVGPRRCSFPGTLPNPRSSVAPDNEPNSPVRRRSQHPRSASRPTRYRPNPPGSSSAPSAGFA